MTFRKYLYFLTTALVVGCSLKSSNDYLDEANELGNKGYYQDAIMRLDKAISKNPKFKEAYLKRGLFNEHLNKLDSAISDYNELLKFDPANTSGIYYIGLIKFEQGKFLEAINYYNRALVTKGFNFSDSSKLQATVDINKNRVVGNSGDATFDIPTDEIIYQRGVAYFKLSKISEAYSDFMNCIAHSYYPGANHYMVGLCYLIDRQNEKACDEFKQAEAFGDTTSREMILKYCK